jgi:hypothetical protein
VVVMVVTIRRVPDKLAVLVVVVPVDRTDRVLVDLERPIRDITVALDQPTSTTPPVVAAVVLAVAAVLRREAPEALVALA